MENENSNYSVSSQDQGRGFTRKVWIAITCCSVLLIVLFAAIYGSVKAIQGYFNSEGSFLSEIFAGQPAPEAGVFVGEQLDWREVAVRGMFGFNGTVVTGNFASNEGDEILYLGFGGESELFDIKGKIGNPLISIRGSIHSPKAWDYDSDGLDEIVSDRSLSSHFDWAHQPLPSKYSDLNPSLVTPVFDIDGRILDNLFGQPMNLYPAPGDFDGDDVEDLLLIDTSIAKGWKVLVYSPVKGKTASFIIPGGTVYGHAGDFNSDGIDEIAFSLSGSNILVYYTLSGTRTVVDGWPLDLDLSYAADATGDGTDDFISATKGYLNAATGGFVDWEFPENGKIPYAYINRVIVADFEGNGNPRIVVITGQDYYGTGIYIFEPSGACSYYEEFGISVSEIAVAKKAGKDYLVVLFNTKLLVWP